MTAGQPTSPRAPASSAAPARARARSPRRNTRRTGPRLLRTGAREQNRILWDDGDATAKIVETEAGDVDAVDDDATVNDECPCGRASV